MDLDEFIQLVKEQQGVDLSDVLTTADKIKPPPENPYKAFMDRNPLAGGGMLVQPSADGRRPGYRDENIRKTRAGVEVSDKKTKVFKYPRKNFQGKTIYYKTPQITREGIEGIPNTVGTKLSRPQDGKQYQVSTKDKNYLFKTEKQAVDFYNKNIKKGSGAQIKDTFDKQSKELKEFFKKPEIYKRYYDGPLNASSIDKIWLSLTSAQKRQAKQLLETQGKNIKEAAKLTKQGYIRVSDLADKLGRTSSLELIRSMKNSQKFKKLFPNYLDGMITASNNTKWIKTTPSTLTKLKQWADDPLPSGLRESTIKNVQTAFKDKKLMNYWKNWKPGTPIDQKLIDSVHGKKGSAYTMMQLGRTLQGKEPIEGVTKNVALGNKIIEAVRYKAKEFGDWHTAAYKYAKQDMDTFLPPGKSGTTFGDYQRLLTKSLNDVGLEGFQVDEINALRSGVRGGTQPYSVFSQILEGKYNQGLKRRFDGENAKNQMKLSKALSMGDNETIRFRPKGASNAITMGKQDYVKYIIKLQNDQVDDFFTKAPQLKGKISLPKFDLRDPKTVYGSRFNTLDPGVQKAILKNFQEVGYTVDVGKKALTQKELLNKIGTLGCPTKKFQLGGRVNFSNGSTCVLKGKQKLENIILKGGAKGKELDLAKTILRAGSGLKNMASIRGILGPAALAFTVGTEAGLVGYDMLSKGETLREAFGNSLLNYALGKDYQIDPQEELFKRFKGLGYDDQQIGSIKRAFDTLNTINTGKNLVTDFEQQFTDNVVSRGQPEEFMMDEDQFISDTAGQRAEQNLKDAQERLIAFNQSLKEVDRPGGMKKEDVLNEYFSSGKYAEDLKLATQAEKEANLQKLTSAGPKFVGSVFPKFEQQRQIDINKNLGVLVNPAFNIPVNGRTYGEGLGAVAFIPGKTVGGLYGFAGGGIAKIAGVDKGPPPESGPNSQGLSGLFKRVKNI